MRSSFSEDVRPLVLRDHRRSGVSAGYPPRLGHEFHSMMRNTAKHRFGWAIATPFTLLRTAGVGAPQSLFLVGTSTPKNLRRIVAEVMA